MSGRDRDAVELRAIAPLVIASTRELVGPIMLVTNGAKTIGVTSSELLRMFEGKALAIVTKLDGSASVPLANWGMGRYSGIALVDLGAAIPQGLDITPLPIGAVCATVDTRGAPSGLATIGGTKGAFTRELIPVFVDSVDTGGGMSDDVLTRLATPIEAADATRVVDGATLFTWFPADPVLGRAKEVLAVAMAYAYRARAFKPRELAPIAELVGLDDLGRALISSVPIPTRQELRQVTGEIKLAKDPGANAPSIDPLDEIRKKRGI